MKIKSLANISLNILTHTFNKAFENYFVPFKLTPQLLSQRIHNSGIDLSHSIGAFENEKLVGFMLIAIDDWGDKRTAYNGGTGVIPEFRGQRLVKQMYDYAIPEFKKLGVEQLILEVICENEKAIKAYESVGMKIDRRLCCYSGEIKDDQRDTIDLKINITNKPNWTMYESIHDYTPSWDHIKQSVNRSEKSYKYVELYQKETLVGFAIINALNGAIPQFGISKDYRRQGLGSVLFKSLADIKSPLKLNNIDSSYTPANEFLKHLGLHNPIDQFEMSGPI